jgi:2-phosphosulfolactate phosphatase
MSDEHGQTRYRVRFDWGPVGAEATSAAYAVVVDVLSFTTTLCVAAERDIEVLPYAWRDSRAAAHALANGATLAVGRFEARSSGKQVSLSPASLASVEGVSRLVLPSPNGSAISFGLAGTGSVVVGACLRNRGAVARWLAAELGSATLTVIAAGERWPDDSLRPCAEDLWGAGAVLDALAGLGVGGFSPEAQLAMAAYRAAALPDDLRHCASGRELVVAGFPEDVEVAGEVDSSSVVPVLAGDRFVAAKMST